MSWSNFFRMQFVTEHKPMGGSMDGVYIIIEETVLRVNIF